MATRLGIFTKVFERPTPQETFAAIAAQGLAAVQLNWETAGLDEVPAAVDPALCRRLHAAAQDQGVDIAAVSGTFNMVHPVHGPEGLRRLDALAQALPLLGTRLITLCTGTRDPDYQWRHHPDNATPQTWVDMRQAMEKAVAVAEKHDAVLCLEPEVNNIVDSAAKARRLLDEIGSPHLKVVIDGANLFHKGQLPRMREVLDEAFDLLGDDIPLAHAKDLEKDGDAGHQAAGTGQLDYAHYLHCLDRIGFDGALVLHSLSEIQVPTSLAYIQSRHKTS